MKIYSWLRVLNLYRIIKIISFNYSNKSYRFNIYLIMSHQKAVVISELCCEHCTNEVCMVSFRYMGPNIIKKNENRVNL